MINLSRHTSAPLHGHLPHLIATLGFVLITLAAVLGYEATHKTSHGASHARATRPPRQPRVAICRVMAGACAASALVHLTVIADHLQESILFGAFFTLLAITQAACSYLLSQPQPRASLVLAVTFASISVAALWLTTRLTSITVGHVLLGEEPVGLSDTLATSLELMTALLAYPALRRTRAGSVASRTDPATAATG